VTDVTQLTHGDFTCLFAALSSARSEVHPAVPRRRGNVLDGVWQMVDWNDVAAHGLSTPNEPKETHDYGQA